MGLLLLRTARMYSYIIPPYRVKAISLWRRARKWSLKSNKAPKASRLPT